MEQALLYYGGQYHHAIEGQSLDIFDPASGEQVGSTALASAADVDRAVTVAHSSFAQWSSTHADERAKLIQRAATLIEERVDAIATLLTREQGKPLADSRKEILFGIAVLRYYAEEGRRIGGTIRASSNPLLRSLVMYQPLGVAAAIVPWNYPVDILCWKIGPALAAGCPIVIKPPHETPLAIQKVIDCFQDAGFPAGVINSLPGTGPQAGAALSAHPLVRIISATASVAAGQQIMRAAATNMTRVSLELGGQAPFLVLPDANIAEAAQAAARRSFSNMGQICITVNRILVHRQVHSQFVDALRAATAQIRLGHGLDTSIAYGPTLNQQVIDRVQAHVDDAVRKGGRLIAGGKRANVTGYPKGHFYEPTLIDAAPVDSLPMTQESYGPIAAIRACDSVAEMLSLGNALPYGLAAYIYSGDLEHAWALAERLECGAIGINVNDVTELQAPFGGWKLSGMGRELGPEGLQAYLEPKHIRLRLRPIE